MIICQIRKLPYRSHTTAHPCPQMALVIHREHADVRYFHAVVRDVTETRDHIPQKVISNAAPEKTTQGVQVPLWYSVIKLPHEGARQNDRERGIARKTKTKRERTRQNDIAREKKQHKR